MVGENILSRLPAELPMSGVPEFVDYDALSNYMISQVASLKTAKLSDKCIWKDSVGMTGDIRTFFGREAVLSVWADVCAVRKPSRFRRMPGIDTRALKFPFGASWVTVPFLFDVAGAPAGVMGGFLDVAWINGAWTIWEMRTYWESIEGATDIDTLAAGTPDPVCPRSDVDYEVIVVGGGQTGLATAGRLKAMGISYLVVEKYDMIGGVWAHRYDSARLHTIREFGHLPFERLWDSKYQEFLHRDDLADGQLRWAEKYKINTWLSTSCDKATFDNAKNIWTLTVTREGVEKTLRCVHLVASIGAGSNVPKTPVIKDRHLFKGEVMHSVDYKNPKAWKGKHGVVIGAANTAHDVAEDMVEQDLASVTMIQRSPIEVVPAENYRLGMKPTYNHYVPIDTADRFNFTMPSATARLISNGNIHLLEARDPERYDALENAGFLLNRNPDMIYCLFHKLGGYHMDVGAGAKIVAGQIKMETASMPERFVEDGLILKDGRHLKADAVVYATGFELNMRTVACKWVAAEAMANVGDVWGLNDEGEIKGAFRPTGHPNLWFTAGAIGQVRFMVRFPVLSIKAALMGTPVPIYTRPHKIQANGIANGAAK